MVRIQQDDFILQDEYQKLHNKHAGAIVIFAGIVREFSQTDCSFKLEHYPEMTQSVLEAIIEKAHNKWDIYQANVIHRIGQLKACDQIVFVGVSAKHRKNAFLACEFIIDTLKTQAPFWKKEGDKWVEADPADIEKSCLWLRDEK